MTMMTVERLHDLFDENPDKPFLEWPGVCHDCTREISVTATPVPEGIKIQGGGVFEPAPNRFFLKCDDCFRRDPVLRNYQDCEVYSRIVGYLRPVHQWNDAKSEEFRNRQVFDASVSA